MRRLAREPRDPRIVIDSSRSAECDPRIVSGSALIRVW